MARPPSQMEALRALTDTLHTVASLDAIDGSALPRVLPQLRALLRADVSCAYSVRVDGTRSHTDFVYADGVAGNFAQASIEFFERAPIPWGHFNPARPDPRQRNRVLTNAELISSPDQPLPPVARELYPKFGLHTKDQVRVLICEDASLLAWVGAFREEPFSASERTLVEALVQPLRTRLALERRLRVAALRSNALTAAMEHLGAAAFVLNPRGVVMDCNSAGRDLLEKDAELQTVLRSAVSGAATEYTLTRLEAAGAAPHYLAVRKLSASTAQERAAAAATRWKLTPRQSQVLALLTEGMSNRAIAARLTCSESTIEIHVSTILAKADVESRAALVARVWSQT